MLSFKHIIPDIVIYQYQMWVVYKEANWIQSIIWIILLICLGRYGWYCSFRLYEFLYKILSVFILFWGMLIQVAVREKMNLLVYIWFIVFWNLFVSDFSNHLSWCLFSLFQHHNMCVHCFAISEIISSRISTRSYILCFAEEQQKVSTILAPYILCNRFYLNDETNS